VRNRTNFTPLLFNKVTTVFLQSVPLFLLLVATCLPCSIQYGIKKTPYKFVQGFKKSVRHPSSLGAAGQKSQSQTPVELHWSFCSLKSCITGLNLFWKLGRLLSIVSITQLRKTKNKVTAKGIRGEQRARLAKKSLLLGCPWSYLLKRIFMVTGCRLRVTMVRESPSLMSSPTSLDRLGLSFFSCRGGVSM